MDLSKAYDCLPNDLLIAKHATYGFDGVSYRLSYKLKLTDYLFQRVKIGATFSSYLEILRNAPILGPILFNLFIKKTEVYNFADDTTIYLCLLNYEEAHRKLSDNTHIVSN